MEGSERRPQTGAEEEHKPPGRSPSSRSQVSKRRDETESEEVKEPSSSCTDGAVISLLENGAQTLSDLSLTSNAPPPQVLFEAVLRKAVKAVVLHVALSLLYRRQTFAVERFLLLVRLKDEQERRFSLDSGAFSAGGPVVGEKYRLSVW